MSDYFGKDTKILDSNALVKIPFCLIFLHCFSFVTNELYNALTNLTTSLFYPKLGDKVFLPIFVSK